MHDQEDLFLIFHTCAHLPESNKSSTSTEMQYFNELSMMFF